MCIRWRNIISGAVWHPVCGYTVRHQKTAEEVKILENGNSLSLVIGKLESLFSSFNDRFYDGQLQKPVITVSPNSRRKIFWGWCTSWKAWSSNEGPDCLAESDGGGYYEINICAEYLNRPFAETSGTLLHEMAHLYNMQIGIQDTCRSGLYHNKQFKRAAEEHGLIVSKDATYGFCITQFNDEAARFVASINDAEFSLHRKKKFGADTAKQKSSTRKYFCPKCGLIIRATRDVNVLCVDCNTEFICSAK